MGRHQCVHFNIYVNPNQSWLASGYWRSLRGSLRYVPHSYFKQYLKTLGKPLPTDSDDLFVKNAR